MGESAEQARQAVAATRERMGATLDRLEQRVRADLAWRSQLRRKGPGLAATGLIVLATGAALWARHRARPAPAEPQSAAEWFAAMPPEWQAELQALVAEAAGRLPTEAGGDRRGGHGSAARRPLWQRLALVAARQAAPLALSALTRRGAGTSPAAD